ncbi:hypothetical protein [Oricola thermophila]|uniref:hypothetical protein n=1 Tax=Oricola thermophila TaxID=2742145 RepID=UPI0018D79F76|nr:hypothetical protein [Oricola thermophila]
MSAAHAANDRAELARLYGEAADRFAAEGDVDRACFFYTHAFVHALEDGAPSAIHYERILRKYGRQ